MKRSFISILALYVALLTSASAVAEVTINRTEPVIERKTFNPNRKPPEMPRLVGKEAAVTQSFYGADSRVGGEVTDSQQTEEGVVVKVTVDTVRMTLKMSATIWLPTNGNAKIKNHEEAHRKIAEYFYKDAKEIATKLANEMIGQTITGKGPTTDAAASNALKEAANRLGTQYLAQTDLPCGVAQKFFDELTEHGTNAVKEDKAIEQAIEEVKTKENRGAVQN